MRWRAERAVVCVALDTFTAVYHRPSGATHLLVEPAPQLLAALADGALTADELMARFDLGEDARAALAARLDELVATGLAVPA